MKLFTIYMIGSLLILDWSYASDGKSPSDLDSANVHVSTNGINDAIAGDHMMLVDHDNLKLLSHPMEDMARRGFFLVTAANCDDTLENKQKGIKLLREAANKGHIEATGDLGYFLVCAMGCEDSQQNKEEGMKLLRDAAKKGYTSAKANLGYFLIEAKGCQDTRQNKEEGIVWLRDAAKEGHLKAKANLALYLITSKGREDNKENKLVGYRYLRELAEQGDVNAKCNLGQLLIDAIGCKDSLKNKEEGIKLLGEAANTGHIRAKACLGYYLVAAKGCEDTSQNKHKGIELLRDAANKGYVSARGNLGYFLVNAIGCEDTQDNKLEGMKLLREAANKGNICAIFNLGVFLTYAKGCADTQQNKEEGIKFLKVCARQGNLLAARELAIIYNEGDVVKRDYALSLKYFTVLYKNGFQVSGHIAHIYFRQEQYDKALEFYKIAQEVGLSVNPGLIEYLERRTAKVPRYSLKGKQKRTLGKKAQEAIIENLNSRKADLLKKAEKLQTLLQGLENKVEEYIAITGRQHNSKPEVSLSDFISYARDFKREYSCTKKYDDKATQIESFENFLDRAEGGIISEMEFIDAGIKNHRLKQILKEDREAGFSLYQNNLEALKQQREDQAATKFNARIKGQKEDAKANQKKRKKKKKGNAKTKSPQSAVMLKSVDEYMLLPFSNVSLEKRGKAEIEDAPYKNALQILNAVKISASYEDLIANLRNLNIDSDLKRVEQGYAGIEDAHEVWQLRINHQYRVLIPLVRNIELKYPKPENPLDNSNNTAEPVETETWTLYQDKIYIADPH